jgi:hypothetical protein
MTNILSKNVVHGLPINGTHNEAPAIEALAGGSFLASYFYTRLGTTKTMTLESQAQEARRQANLEGYRMELSRANERTAA